MVQTDGGDDGQFRGDDVRGIQPAAEPGLDDRGIHAGVREPLESQAGGNLEEGQALFDEIGLPGGQEVENVVLGDEFEGVAGDDPGAFPEVHQMRRGVQAHLQPRRAKHRS